MSNLRNMVEAEIVNAIPTRGFKIVNSEDSPSFGNATVILEGGNLRLRIVRERGQILVDVGSVHTPDVSFDSANVFEFLSLSREAGFHGDNADTELAGLQRFLTVFGNELEALFSSDRVHDTNRRIEEVRQAQSERRWG